MSFKLSRFRHGVYAFIKELMGIDDNTDLLKLRPISLKEFCDNLRNYTLLLTIFTVLLLTSNHFNSVVKVFPSLRYTPAGIAGGIHLLLDLGAGFIGLLILANFFQSIILGTLVVARFVQLIQDETDYCEVCLVPGLALGFGFGIGVAGSIMLGFFEIYRHLTSLLL